MRWFSSHFLVLLVIASVAPAAELLPADKPTPEAIDRYVDAKLTAANTTQAPQADDNPLIRRRTPDLVGRNPTPDETRPYVESKNPKNPEQLVDRLMSSPALVRHQPNQFDAMLSGPNTRGGSGSLREYLVRAL